MVDLSNDKDILRRLYKECKNYRERERYHALLLIASGRSKKEVASIFFVDEDTVNLWTRKWETERTVVDKSREGKPPKIDEKLERIIVKLVDENNPRKSE